MNPIRTMDVEGRVLFRRTNGQFRPQPHTPPYATQEERAMTAARRGKPLTGTMMLRPALGLPAPTSDANRVEYELTNGLLIMRVKDARDKAGVMSLDVQGVSRKRYTRCVSYSEAQPQNTWRTARSAPPRTAWSCKT